MTISLQLTSKKLNPNMKEAVKKEVLKLFKISFI